MTLVLLLGEGVPSWQEKTPTSKEHGEEAWRAAFSSFKVFVWGGVGLIWRMVKK